MPTAPLPTRTAAKATRRTRAPGRDYPALARKEAPPAAAAPEWQDHRYPPHPCQYVDPGVFRRRSKAPNCGACLRTRFGNAFWFATPPCNNAPAAASTGTRRCCHAAAILVSGVDGGAFRYEGEPAELLHRPRTQLRPAGPAPRLSRSSTDRLGSGMHVRNDAGGHPDASESGGGGMLAANLNISESRVRALVGRNSLAPEIDNVTGDNMVYVFALPEAPTGQELNRPNAAN